MPTAVVERYGSLSATGIAKEATFGTAVAATTFLPMTSNGLELDPSLFSPKVMFGQRDLNSWPLYGQFKAAGSLSAPLFPTNGMTLLAGSIGADAAAGNGVTGTGSASANTLNGGVSAGATTVVLTSATGYTVGSYIQIDVNGSGPTTTAEVRKITVVSTNTLTLDAALGYAHLTGAATKVVTAPFTHTITQANTLPSFTVEKNLGNFESLQFTGSRINKFGLQQSAGNTEATLSVDLMSKNAAVLTTPTAISVTNENPYVYAEATATIFGTAVTQTTSVDLSIENGLKDTFTMAQAHTAQFITPVTLHASGKVDLVFTSLDDATWGYWTQMVNGTGGALAFSLAHPSSGGTVTINLPTTRIKTNGDAVKMEDVIITSLNFEAFLTFSTLTTLNATVINNVWLPY
jgi:hypothetical protein